MDYFCLYNCFQSNMDRVLLMMTHVMTHSNPSQICENKSPSTKNRGSGLLYNALHTFPRSLGRSIG